MATISYVHLDVGNGLTTKNTNGLLKLFIDEDSKLELTSAGLYCPPLGSAQPETSTGIKKPALSSIGTCMIYAVHIGQGSYSQFDENGSTLNGRYPMRGGNLKFLSMNDKLYDLNFWINKTGSSCYPFYDSDIVVGELGTQYVQTITSSYHDNEIIVTNDYGFTSNTSTASGISSYPDYDRNDRKCMKVTQGFNIENYRPFTYCIWVDESKDVVRTDPSLTKVFHPVYLSPTSAIPVGFLQYDRNEINENYFQPTLYRIDNHKIYYDKICYTDYIYTPTTTAEIDFSAMTEDSDYEFIVMEYGYQINGNQSLRYFKNVKPGDITAFHVITDLELYEANPPTESTYYVTNPLDENDTTTLPRFNVDFTIDESGTVSPLSTSSGTSSASTTSTTSTTTTSTASTTSTTTTTTSSSVDAITTKYTIDQSTMVDNWTISVVDQNFTDFSETILGHVYGIGMSKLNERSDIETEGSTYDPRFLGSASTNEVLWRHSADQNVSTDDTIDFPIYYGHYVYDRDLIQMNPKVVEQCFSYSMYKLARTPAKTEKGARLSLSGGADISSTTTSNLKTCSDLITEINFPLFYRIWNNIKNYGGPDFASDYVGKDTGNTNDSPSTKPPLGLDHYEYGQYRLPVYPRIGNLIVFSDHAFVTTCHRIHYPDTRICGGVDLYHPYEDGQRHSQQTLYDSTYQSTISAPQHVYALFIITKIEYIDIVNVTGEIECDQNGNPLLSNLESEGYVYTNHPYFGSYLPLIKEMTIKCVWSDQSYDVLTNTQGWKAGDVLSGKMLVNTWSSEFESDATSSTNRLRDQLGNIIPAEYDTQSDSFEPYYGELSWRTT